MVVGLVQDILCESVHDALTIASLSQGCLLLEACPYFYWIHVQSVQLTNGRNFMNGCSGSLNQYQFCIKIDHSMLQNLEDLRLETEIDV